MRRFHLLWSLCAFLIVALGISLAADPPAADALRYVEIYPVETARPADLEKPLKALGFVPSSANEFPQNGTGPIRGRIPQANLGKAADLASVGRIALGSVLAADPPAIAEYGAFIRFRIDANQQERYAQYARMIKRLSEAGFKRTERDPPALEDDWRYSDVIDGVVPAKGANSLLQDGAVRSVLLIPSGYQAPEKPLVELMLDGFGDRQPEVVDRLRARLKKFDFEEAVGYDHRDRTRLIGRLPGDRVAGLYKEAFEVELPLKAERDPLKALGRILIPVTVYFEGRKTSAEITKALEPLGFELGAGGKEVPGKGGHVKGRLLTRHLRAAGEIAGVTQVVPEPAKAVELTTVIRQAMVLREPANAVAIPAPPPPPEIPADQPWLRKLSMELLRQLPKLQADAPDRPIQVEVVLRRAPAYDDREWSDFLGRAAVPFAIDGSVGPFVFGSIVPAELGSLAKLAEVSTVRLPHAALEPVMPPFNPKSPTETGLDFIKLNQPTEPPKPLAEFLRKREKHRVAVIDADFRGWKDFVGKGLPAKTQLLDLTAERNPQLYPDAFAGEAGTPGNGTRLALALADLTPLDEMILVRIDPALPYQVQSVAKAISGDAVGSEALRRRENEIEREKQRLNVLRRELRVERRLVLENFRSDEDARKARAEYRKRQEQFDKDEQELAARQRRFLDLSNALVNLRGVQTALLGLRWIDGQPNLPGERGGVRALEPRLLRSAVWIQALPTTTGQVWTGLFRDANQDDAMDFTASADSRERLDLNFLAWQPWPWREPKLSPKIVEQQLPAHVVVELTLTWREIHSPDWKQAGADDVYRTGIAPLNIVLLRQVDPAGQWLPTDIFEVVDRSQGWPDRVENQARYAVYQRTLRFVVPKDGGRYAVRIEGMQPESTLPTAAIPAPNAERWELNPKLLVNVVDPTHRPKGRVLFQNYTTAE